MSTNERVKMSSAWWGVSNSPIGRRIRFTLFALSVVAGMVHIWVMPEHFQEWSGYGIFFALIGMVQVLAGVAWLALPANVSTGRGLALLGIGTNLMLMALYGATRTVGIPLFGPHAGEVESVGTIDVVSKTVELALTGLLLLVLWQGGFPKSRGTADTMNSLPRLLGSGTAILVALGLFVYAASPLGTGSAGTHQAGAVVPASEPHSAATSRSGQPAGSGKAAASATAVAVPSAARGGERVVLAVNDAGFLRPFANGDQVLTTGPFALRIRLDPYPPTGNADLDITVVDAEDEQVVADAALILRWEMPGHGHGVTPVRLPNRGDGHYGTRLNLNMGGDWTFDVDVRQGSRHGLLKMLVSSPGG